VNINRTAENMGGSTDCENFTRVETFGFPNSRWVRVTIGPADPDMFRFRQEIVDENRVKQLRINM